MWCKVTSQAEMDAAIASRKSHIELAAEITVEVRVPTGFMPVLRAVAGAVLRVLDSSRVVAWGSSHVEAWGYSHVVAWGYSHVEARESSHVEAWGYSHVEAWGSSRVVAWGYSRVVAWGASHVEAWGSSRVVAWESSHVEAWESSHVEARESSHVEARGSAALSLFGLHVTAKASSQVAVHLHDGARCDGGVQIVVNRPQTPREWCEWYGVEISGENAVLYKAVDAAYRSPYGAVYAPGTETVAPDWDGGQVDCGYGLHFSPHPAMARSFNDDAEKFVACLVPLEDIAVHSNGSYPEKVKAHKCWNWYECDVFGDVVGEKHERANTTDRN